MGNRVSFRANHRAAILRWKKSWIFLTIDRVVSKHFRGRLTNDNFSIICSNCIGGTIYHRLGKKFLSPTINLFIPERQFPDFCLHLKYYLAQEPEIVESDLPYPLGMLRGDGKELPDIEIHFNHDHDPKEACRKWNDRKQRIHWDNLYLICYNLDGITVDQLRQMEQIPCNNRVVLTKVPLPEISWSYYIEPNNKYKFPLAYLGKDAFGVRHFEKEWDFVSFLNKR